MTTAVGDCSAVEIMGDLDEILREMLDLDFFLKWKNKSPEQIKAEFACFQCPLQAWHPL